MTISRIESGIGVLGQIDDEAAARVAFGARRLAAWPGTVPLTRERPARRRRVLAGALVALLAVALVLVIRPWGGDPASAGLLQRVRLAVTPPPHTIEHIRQVQHQGSSDVTTESWQSIDDPGMLRWRQTTSSCGGWLMEQSSTLSQQQWFDPDHDRVLRIPLVPAQVRASWPEAGPRVEFDPTVSFAAALRRGDAHVAGHSTIDGKAVTQIRWPVDPVRDPGSLNILYVDTGTGAPVAYDWGGGKLDATGGIVARQRFSAYEFVPEGADTDRALSVRASHPDAALPPITTEKQLSAAYQDAQRVHCGGVG
jgi:hypothetical protein